MVLLCDCCVASSDRHSVLNRVSLNHHQNLDTRWRPLLLLIIIIMIIIITIIIMAQAIMAQGLETVVIRSQPCPSMVCCSTECRFANQCWRPLCPYTHPKEGRRAQRWADLWKFLAHEETRESHRLGMPRVRREFSVKHWEHLPEGTEHVTPAPDVGFTGPAPMTEHVDTLPAVTYAAPVPVIEYAEPAVTDTAPASADVYVAPAPAVTYAAPAPVIEYAEPAVTDTAAGEYEAPAPAVSHAAHVFDRSIGNSDPRMRTVLIYRFNSNYHSIFTLHVTGCDFQHGPNFCVPSNPTFRVSWFFISWQSVLTTCHWFCELWELVSVLCREVLSDINRCQESCIITKLNHTTFGNRSSCAGSSVEV